jgi:hypothetical protein
LRRCRGSNLRLGEPGEGFAKTSLYLDTFCGQKRGSKQLVMEAEPAATAPEQVGGELRTCRCKGKGHFADLDPCELLSRAHAEEPRDVLHDVSFKASGGAGPGQNVAAAAAPAGQAWLADPGQRAAARDGAHAPAAAAHLPAACGWRGPAPPTVLLDLLAVL